MIFVALGANLPSIYGEPKATLLQAIFHLREKCAIVDQSNFYQTPAWPESSNQPDYINAVVQVSTMLPPDELMQFLHQIENRFGRIRKIRNEARTLDLDLIAYHDKIIFNDGGLILPHPRMHERLFVLDPLCDVAPNWTHPILKKTARRLQKDNQDKQ